MKVNSNHEITTQKQKEDIFSPQWDLNHGPLKQKFSVQPFSYTDPLTDNLTHTTHFLVVVSQTSMVNNADMLTIINYSGDPDTHTQIPDISKYSQDFNTGQVRYSNYEHEFGTTLTY